MFFHPSAYVVSALVFLSRSPSLCDRRAAPVFRGKFLGLTLFQELIYAASFRDEKKGLTLCGVAIYGRINIHDGE